MSEAKLLTCPFCGGEAELYNDTNHCVFVYGVYCKKCGCRQEPSIHKEAVINAWNTRKPMDDIVERLERIKMNYFLTIANTGDVNNDFSYENVGNALDNAIEIIKGGVK